MQTFNKRRSFVNIALIAALLFALIAYAGVYAAQVGTSSLQIRGGTNTPVMIDAELRTSAILTTSYVVTNFTRLAQAQDLGVWFELEKGSLTSFQYKIQWSRDGDTWFDEVTETIVAGIITDTILYYTHVFVADDQFYKPLPVRAPYIRLSVKGTGTVTSSACAVYLTGVNN